MVIKLAEQFDSARLTINVGEQPPMRSAQKPGDEKRALVIVPHAEWDDWLDCKGPEFARSFLRHYPAEQMRSWEFPVPPRAKKPEPAAPDTQMGLL